MAGLTPNLPSRSRQLFSAEGSSGPSVELNSNPPPKVRAFIDNVIQFPLQDIAIPLSGFRWEYSEGNFHHWSPLFHHFDTYFKTYLSRRNDLLLSDHVNVMEDDPFPKHAVMQILRVMQIILENCHQKSSFNASEHFKLLLASTDPEVLLATLETLSALVKIHTSKRPWNAKLIELGSINSCLLSMAQGWGSKEQGLGLYSCVVASEKSQEEGLSLFPSDIQESDGKCQYRLGSTLYFEFHGVSPQRRGESSSSAKFATSAVIEMQDLHLHKEDYLLLLKQCVDKYNVPLDQRFSLLTRIRYALSVRSPKTCRLYNRICLLSFIVLVQSNNASEELLSFFANEPEYMIELVRIVCSEDLISESIRALAMVALRAQLAAWYNSRVRILRGSIVDFSEENWMVLLNVLQKALLSLKSCNDPSSLAFVEAYMQFYLQYHYCFSSSDTRKSGMVLTLLPLLEDFDSCHLHVVCHAVKTLQKLISSSDTAMSLLRDLGGVELLAQRLQVEVHMVTGLGGARDSSVITVECSDDGHLYTQTRLIKALLKALGLAIFAPANSSTSLNPCDSSLPSTLCLIFGSIDKFGGDVYCSAVTLMSKILHNDPTCFPALQKLGLPEAFLSSVVGGIYPSPRALTCIPRGLGAICLNNKGLKAVKEASAIHFLVDIFTCKKFIITVNEALIPLTWAVLELLRKVSSLRGAVVDIIIEIVNKIASFGESGSFVVSGSLDSLAKAKRNMVMDMDSGEQGNGASSSQVSKDDSAVEGTTDGQFLHSSILHVIVLIQSTMEDSETCRLFVEKSGVDALLKLLLQPSIIQSSEGMAIALRSTEVFKGFTKNYPAPLARAFCSALREHLQNTLTGINKVSGTFLLDPKSNPDLVVFPSLFLVEFLLFLAASKDRQWASVLLTELSGDGIDVVQGLGCVHKEILWQIALLEHAQFNVPGGKSISPSESQRLAYVTIENRRQILWKRRMYESTESEFSHLLNQYRDLGQSGGTKQLHSFDVSSVRPGNNSQLSQSSYSKTEQEKQRTCCSSSCSMVESLSFLIVHMFKELGKAMLLTSHCQDDTLDVSPYSKRVVLTFADIALEHVNFVGHTSPFGLEASVSIKGRYLGKVIDFIDDILMVRPDLCNPILLNCLYGIGFIPTLLTAFQATSQLLFAVNRSTASQSEHSWIYGPSASFVKLMENLVTSSSILSPFTKHLLVQPISDGRVPFPKDAEAFVKVLQSMVLKYVLPIWTHPQSVGFDYVVIAPIISIISHVYCVGGVKNVGGSTSACIAASPANESTIVEIGRAENALKQVEANFVELAIDLLLSPSDEAREDDELASALAMSLRNSGSDSKEDADVTHLFEEEMIQLPPIDQLLSTCVKLLQAKESLAFPVRGLLMVMCSQNYGQNLSNIIAFIIDQMRHSYSVSDAGKNKALFALFHVLTLMLHENPTLRNIALKNGLVELASNLLCDWDAGRYDEDKTQEPKWIAAAFLALDQLFQVDKKPNPETVELLKKNTDKIQQTSIIIDESSKKCLIQLACSCIKKQLTSVTLHAVLQLSATLTRNHYSAVSFIDFGGLPLLLNLPASSLFSGFDNIAASTIRHLLEDPHTLQQAMESVIKHIVMTATNRHSNGRLTPQDFLSKLTSVLSRDPVVFMQAAKSVCQVEMVRDKPYIVLLKDDDKDKEKDKPVKEGKAQIVDGNAAAGNLVSASEKVGHGKLLDCFVSVVEHLLNLVIAFEPSLEVNTDTNGVSDLQTVSDMDMLNAAKKGKGKVVSSASECTKTNNQDSASLAKVVFILKLLTEILVTYSASVHVLLRMDAGVSSCRPPLRQGDTRYSCSGIFNHILHKFVVHSRNLKKEQRLDSDWMSKLATRASQFLVASCLRSGEARKRIFTEVNSVFHEFVEAADGFSCPGHDLQTFIDLLNDVLGARHLTGLSTSAEAADTFIDAGLVGSLTRTLQVLDLDHPESSKLVTGLVKALEMATKQYMADIVKADTSIKASDGHGNFVEEDEEHHVEDDDDQEDYEIDEDGFGDLDEEEEEEEDDNIFEVFGTDNSFPPHPLLVELPHFLFSASSRVSDNFHTLEYLLIALSDNVAANRNIDNTSSHLDTIFGSLRTRSQGYIRAIGESGLPVVPKELEVFLVSHLRRLDAEKHADQKKTLRESLNKSDVASLQESDTIVRPEELADFNADHQNRYFPAPSFVGLENSSNTRDRTAEEVAPQPQSVEMQFETNDVVVQDVEAVTQENGGSGATLRESLHSLDFEIGSANGHDDGGDRPDSSDRISLGKREMSLHSVSKVMENPDQDSPAEGQQMNEDGISGSIDPALVDTLPEELRAEVLSAHHGQVAQPFSTEQQNTGDIDPEFLAALSPGIRVEVLAQQQAQRLHQSQELEGKPMEMDGASIIATFPSDLREEVLLTSSDSVLANLTPALVAEENMLHERLANRYHSDAFFGMYPRSQRVEPSRRSEGSNLDSDKDSFAFGRSIGGKLLPVKRSPLVDADALKGMIRLLQVFHVSDQTDPLKLPYKGHLQRLLLNLCTHNETRTELVQMLMGMLMLDTQKAGNQLTASKPSYHLYACHSYAMYSLPQFFEGVPPFVSRRVLETMTYLARNSPSVAKIMLEFRLPQQSQRAFQSFDDRHVRARMPKNYYNVKNGEEQESKPSIALLLGLLNLPLYLRSKAHLQQLLKLLDVLIDDAESKSNSLDGSGLSISEQHSASQVSTADTEMNNSVATVASQLEEGHKSDESAKSSIGGYEAQNMLYNLPPEELRLLCALLAKEGLPDAAYTVVANLLKKLATFSATHSHVFITELASSLHKLTKAATEKLRVCSDPEKLLLQSSSNGTSILRVLQVLSSLVASLREHDAVAALSRARDIVVVVEPLWPELSSWIGKVEGYLHSAADPDSSRAYTSKASNAMPAFPVGTQNILPYIESFFVSCEKVCLGQPDGSQDYSVAAIPNKDDACSLIRKQSRGHPSKINEKHIMFVKFSERHHKLLNAFIRQNPGLLEKSLSLMLRVPRFIDFDIKLSHFRSKIKHHQNRVKISVKRASILEDSYDQLHSLSTEKLKGWLNVHFLGEEGIDAGGLTREWYQVLSRAIFDRGALLFTTVGNDSTFQPNPNSVCQTEHLSYFKFAGRVVGKALFDGHLVDVHFTRSFYKHMLGAKVTYHDIEAIDPEYYKNLKWMLENDISEVPYLTFSREADEKLIIHERTGVTDYELIPGGRSIKVTEENKHQYVDLVAEHKLTTAIQPQINAFLEGFHELVPRELISIFNDKELELLISGLPDIDVDDMRANTEYSGYNAGDAIIQWFWEVVEGFSKEERACLLQFVTGTSKVPLEGFSAIPGISGTRKLKIQKAYGSIDHLPTAHTCFNQMDLPNYPSKEHLRERLLLAIHEGKEGFGFC